MKARDLAVIFCGGALLAPLLAFGHGVEFLLAKWEIGPDRVRMEVTADCEGNLMLPDREAAVAAMNRLFVVSQRPKGGGNKKSLPWLQLAPLRFEDRSALDPTVPLPPDPSWADRNHLLVTGIWEWVPPPDHEFRLQVPRGEPVDTLLWRPVAGEGENLPPWRILISGDETDWFILAARSGRRPMDWWRIVCAAGVMGWVLWVGVRRYRG